MPQGATYLASRILVVDDEEANVILLDRMLRRAGYSQVSTTQDSREVMRLIDETAPDLILLDLLMPHLNGYEILDKIAAENQGQTYLPVLVLTADVTRQALQRALGAGARDFLTKPFDQTELLLRVRNLLETRHLYLGLQRQLQRLEQVNDETRHAVSAMAHDIGQPLAAVRLMTEMLQQEASADRAVASEALAQDLSTIYAASDQMAEMIAEVSDLTRMQIGRPLVLTRSPLDLVSLVRQQVDSAARAGKRKISCEADVEKLEGRWDRQRLNRVISNLLNNAVKFTPKNRPITVAVGLDGEAARLTFTDAGMGIPAEDLPHVFEPYFRAGNVTGRVEGSGIGLASARQIIEQHGGSIAIESEPGQGTTVTITLPLT